MKKLIILILALITIIPAYAQNRVISGTVRDENGNTMPGAIIVVKSGSKTGAVTASTTTDISGKYVVECKDNDYISAHFLGYNEYIFPVKGSKKVMDITMIPDAAKLDDVVVIGYGATTKADLTGSVTNVKMAEIREEPVLSIDQALQGRIAGMVVTRDRKSVV